MLICPPYSGTAPRERIWAILRPAELMSAAVSKTDYLGTAGSGYDETMLSQDTLERYRRMSPGDRLALALRLTEENIPALLEGPPAVVRRRFEILARENEQRNRNMLTAIARSKAHQ